MNRDFGTRERAANKTWKQAYIDRYAVLRVMRSIPLEEWNARTERLVSEYPDLSEYVGLDLDPSRIQDIGTDPYRQIYGMYNVMGMLIELYKELGEAVTSVTSGEAEIPIKNRNSVLRSVNDLGNEILSTIERILNTGYDVNRSADDEGNPFPLPFVDTFIHFSEGGAEHNWNVIKLLLAHGLDLYQSDVYLPEDNVTFASYASAYEHAIIRFSDLLQREVDHAFLVCESQTIVVGGRIEAYTLGVVSRHAHVYGATVLGKLSLQLLQHRHIPQRVCLVLFRALERCLGPQAPHGHVHAVEREDAVLLRIQRLSQAVVVGSYLPCVLFGIWYVRIVIRDIDVQRTDDARASERKVFP